MNSRLIKKEPVGNSKLLLCSIRLDFIQNLLRLVLRVIIWVNRMMIIALWTWIFHAGWVLLLFSFRGHFFNLLRCFGDLRNPVTLMIDIFHTFRLQFLESVQQLQIVFIYVLQISERWKFGEILNEFYVLPQGFYIRWTTRPNPSTPHLSPTLFSPWFTWNSKITN